MLIVKQMDIRSNIKKYFDKAYDGEEVIVPRKNGHNVVIISEREYNRLKGTARLNAYSQALGASAFERKSRSLDDPANINAMNHKKLDRIRQMKDGWNGNGAPALPSFLIESAKTLIDELVIQPEIFPTAMGTLQFEYDNSRRDHMEIEIAGNDMAEVFVVLFNGEEIYETISCDAVSINKKVSDFYG